MNGWKFTFVRVVTEDKYREVFVSLVVYKYLRTFAQQT